VSYNPVIDVEPAAVRSVVYDAFSRPRRPRSRRPAPSPGPDLALNRRAARRSRVVPPEMRVVWDGLRGARGCTMSGACGATQVVAEEAAIHQPDHRGAPVATPDQVLDSNAMNVPSGFSLLQEAGTGRDSKAWTTPQACWSGRTEGQPLNDR
jgi:hypothetical protein